MILSIQIMHLKTTIKLKDINICGFGVVRNNFYLAAPQNRYCISLNFGVKKSQSPHL